MSAKGDSKANNTPPAKPEHGIIVADTSLLFDLYPNTGPKQPNGEGPRYISILPFLAENGYKIIIPEMVALEAAEVLAGGKSVYAYFEHAPQKHSPEMTRYLADFLIDVAKHPEKHPNIVLEPEEPPHHGEPNPVYEYLKKLHEIIDNAHTPPGREAFDRETQKAIKKHQHLGNKSHFGDVAVWRTLKRHENGSPIFLVSDDTRFMRDMANLAARELVEGPGSKHKKHSSGSHKTYDVTLVTVNGLMHAVAKSGLHRHIPGLENASDGYKMNAQRRQNAEVAQNNTAMDYNLVNAALGWEIHCTEEYRPGPLCESFKLLNRKLDSCGRPKPVYSIASMDPADDTPPKPSVPNGTLVGRVDLSKVTGWRQLKPLQIRSNKFNGLKITDDKGREI